MWFGKKVFKRRIQFKKGRLVCLLSLDLERERGRKKNLYSIIFWLGKGEPFFKTNPNPKPKPISSIRSEAFNVMMKNPKEQEGKKNKKENNHAAAMINRRKRKKKY